MSPCFQLGTSLFLGGQFAGFSNCQNAAMESFVLLMNRAGVHEIDKPKLLPKVWATTLRCDVKKRGDI